MTPPTVTAAKATSARSGPEVQTTDVVLDHDDVAHTPAESEAVCERSSMLPKLRPTTVTDAPPECGELYIP